MQHFLKVIDSFRDDKEMERINLPETFLFKYGKDLLTNQRVRFLGSRSFFPRYFFFM